MPGIGRVCDAPNINGLALTLAVQIEGTGGKHLVELNRDARSEVPYNASRSSTNCNPRPNRRRCVDAQRCAANR
jgi:hypothetical protein